MGAKLARRWTWPSSATCRCTCLFHGGKLLNIIGGGGTPATANKHLQHLARQKCSARPSNGNSTEVTTALQCVLRSISLERLSCIISLFFVSLPCGGSPASLSSVPRCCWWAGRFTVAATEAMKDSCDALACAISSRTRTSDRWGGLRLAAWAKRVRSSSDIASCVCVYAYRLCCGMYLYEIWWTLNHFVRPLIGH